MTSPDGVLASLGLSPARSSTPTSGFDATVWRVEFDGQPDGGTVAVRLLQPGRSSGPELAAMALAAERGVPVPTVVATGRHQSCDVVVTTWCRGRTIGDLLLAGGDPDALGLLLGRTHADLHRPATDGSVLCHLDLQPFNVLAEGDTVTGIVDWTNARLGDPRADIAHTRVVFALAPALFPDADDALAAFADGWRRGYADRRPMPDDRELAPFLAEAADRQWESWSLRGADGLVTPDVVEAARRITETAWSDLSGSTRGPL